MMFFFLLSAILLLITRGIYALYLHKDTAHTTGDAIVHLGFIKEYYKNRGKPVDPSYMYILDKADYPNGFHKIFYYLGVPIEKIERFGAYAPMFFDLFYLSLIAVAIKFFGGEAYEWLLFFPFLRVFWGNEGRAAHFSERAYGVLWGNIYLFCVVAGYLTSEPLWIIGAVLSFSVTGISSKFAWQSTAIFSIALSLFTLNFYFVFVFCVAVIVSIFLTKGYSLHVLRGVIRHSNFYREHLSPRNPALRNNYAEILDFSVGIKRYIYTFFTNSPLRIILDIPLSVAAAFFIFLGTSVSLFEIWFIAGCLIVLLISTKWLKFLGEPERYIEFFVLPTFVILSFFPILEFPMITLLCLFIATVVVLYHVAFIIFMEIRSNKKDEQNHLLLLSDFFKDIKDAVIITIPLRISYFLGYRNDGNRFVAVFSNVGEGKNNQEYRWLLKDRYPFVRGDLDELSRKYNLDYIVVHKSSVEFMNKTYEGGYYDLSPYKAVYENDSYAVYSVKT